MVSDTTGSEESGTLTVVSATSVELENVEFERGMDRRFVSSPLSEPELYRLEMSRRLMTGDNNGVTFRWHAVQVSKWWNHTEGLYGRDEVNKTEGSDDLRRDHRNVITITRRVWTSTTES